MYQLYCEYVEMVKQHVNEIHVESSVWNEWIGNEREGGTVHRELRGEAAG